VNTCTEETIFVSYTQTTASLDHVRGLQNAIEGVSRLRYTLAHEDAHLAFGRNATGMTAIFGAFKWLAGIYQVDRWQQTLTADELVAGASLDQDQHLGIGFGGLRVSSVVALQTASIMLAIRADAFPPVDRTALLRLVDGILTALCLTLILVLAALARRPDRLTFVLVMLAACLRYGRREEPDDHAFLPKVDIGHRRGE
jgi:hypothetical protein